MIIRIAIAVILGIYGSAFLYLFYKLHKHTRELRYTVAAGDNARFKHETETRTGTVEKVFYRKNKKMVKIKWLDHTDNQYKSSCVVATNIYLAK